MIIYKATNLINGKIYIGQTVNKLQIRKSSHMCEANARHTYYFANALSKYGKDNFKWQVICICPNIDSLNEQEQYYIAYFNSMNRSIGYNLQSGGLNFRMSDEQKKEISITRKEWFKNNPNKVLKGKNHWSYGVHPTEETKQKMREARVLRIGDKAPYYGKKKTPKQLLQMSNITKKLWESSEYRKKVLKARKGIKATPEAIENMRIASKKRWQNPQYREKVLKAKKLSFKRTS